MPTSTFFNLPEEKKKRILNSAIAEFAAKTYDEANIASIIRNAEIPRGSFYQYFADKKDLYKYILDMVGQQKMVNLTPIIARKQELGFYGVLRELLRVGIQFFLDHPKWARIGELFMNSPSRELKREIYGEQIPEASVFYRQILSMGLENGEINPAINIDLIAEILYVVVNTTLEQYLRNNKLENLDEIMGVIEEMIDFIQKGIGI